ncbi:MAG: AMP-binding protein [Candidatus Zixiibacteriota bacterium]
MRNIAARFFHAVEKHGQLPAMGYSGEDAIVTYHQLGEKVKECALCLSDIEPGEAVGLLSENRPEWGKVYLGILSAGGTVVPFDSLLKKDELKQIFIDSGIKRVFVSHKFIDIAESIVSSIDREVKIYDLTNIPVADTKEFVPRFSENKDETAVIIFTSGTTGKAKQVMLTHNNILSDIDSILICVRFRAGDSFLSVLPLHHTFEATAGFLLAILNGCAIYYVRELNSREIMTGFQRHNISYFIAVPLILEKLYHGILGAVKKAPLTKRLMFTMLNKSTRAIYSLTGKNAGKKLFASLRQKAGLSSLKLIVSGGAPLPIEVAKGFSMLGFTLLEGYGLTETSPVLTVNLPEKIKFGSVGKPLPRVELKIDSIDDSGIGEVLAKGPMVTPGYKNNHEATNALFDNGWMRTGDVGYIDDEGFLFIKGRAKNLIVSAAGKNIYPEEIEAQLLNSDFILEAMVYGHKANNGREEVAALIYPDYELLAAELGKQPGSVSEADCKTVVGKDIQAICSRMADFKRVKHITYTREELAKTSTRKIKRYLY